MEVTFLTPVWSRSCGDRLASVQGGATSPLPAGFSPAEREVGKKVPMKENKRDAEDS